MKLGELKGKPVVSIADARKVGTVDGVFVDAGYTRIQGLKVKGEGRSPDYFVSSENVRAIGPDAVTIVGQDALERPDYASGLTGLVPLEDVLGSRVVTESGEVLGGVSDVHLDPSSGKVERFEYATGPLAGLLRRHYSIDVEHVVGVGPKVMTVKEAARPSQAA
jgi:sporulation protein YlmC with PRC-barrel domain